MGDFDVIVVGAGIFGSLITRALRKSGRKVFTIDDRREGNGSMPAACLMRPSWFSDLGKNVYEPSLALLSDLVGVKEITFKIPVGTTQVYWSNPRKIMLRDYEYQAGSVRSVYHAGKSGWRVDYWQKSGAIGHPAEPAHAPAIICAAGIWTNLIAPTIEVNAQAGVAWLWSDKKITHPFIKVWAPYKQIVGFDRGDGTWIGDGLAIKNWSNAYERASLKRCASELGKRIEPADDSYSNPKRLFGQRPYVKGAKPCLLQQVHPGFWVATGGAKNGTIAAGWAADQLLRAL
jgi:hypothetical protein